MADSTIWWVLTGVVVGLELLTGSFYLLMLAAGGLAAALAAHAGLSFTAQIVIAGLVGGAAVLVLRRLRAAAHQVPSSGQDNNLDVGETITVEEWRADGSCSVKYRGANWTAMLAPGEQAAPGPWQIADVQGNRLLLKKPH